MTGRCGAPGPPQRRQRLVAVHLRHEDVEQDHVDRRLVRVAQPVERLPAVLRLDGLVPDPAQQPGQQLAVEGGVVDDEDAPRLGRSVAGGWGHAGPPVKVGRAFAIAASSSSGRIGLLT